MRGNWAEAYLDQARADLFGAELIQGEEPSVVAMLIQMSLEKLGKAALLASGSVTVEDVRSTHRAATPMLQQLVRSKRACGRLEWRPEVVRTAILPLVDALERAHPQLAAGGPSLEYPWEDPSGLVCRPCRDLPVARAFSPRDTRGQRLMQFTRDLADRFDEVYRSTGEY